MKSSVLAGLALALALALALVLWFTNAPGTGAASASRPEAATEATAKSGAALDAAASKAETLEEVAAAAVKRTQEPTAVAAGPALAITGRVEPAGGCEEKEVEVYALKSDGDYGDLDLILDGETKTSTRDPRVLGRAHVEENGSFRIEVPADTTKVHVHARGRYLYTHDSVPVNMNSPDPIALVTQCGACVEGRIVPPAGVEMLGEEIDVALETSIETKAAMSGGGDRVTRSFHAKDGRFEFRALSASSGYELSFEPAAFPAQHQPVVGLIAGRTQVVDVQLQRGGTLRGLVRAADGTPIKDASVEAKRKGRWFGFDDKVIRERKSGADGTFTLPAVALGSVLVTAKREGQLAGDPLKVDVKDGGTIEGLVVELGDGNSIHGTLSWPDGKPASGARVDVEFDKAHMIGMEALNAVRGASGKATTDAAGGFTVTGLGVGPFTVTARVSPPRDPDVKVNESSDVREKLMHRARADGVKPGAKELALVLTAPTNLSGRVLDKAGQPIRKAHVHATSVGSGMLKGYGQEEADATVENDLGEFVVTLMRTGAWTLVASAEGYADSEPIEVTVPRKAGEPELVITLEKSGVAMGIVVDPHGVRVANATVELATDDPNWMRALSKSTRPTAKSDSEGKFVLEGLKPGHVALCADSKDWAKSVDTPLELAPGESRDGLVLTLREGGSLTGEVYENGKPGASMLVQVTLLKSYSQHAAFSDAAGRFEVQHLEAGSYQVVAMHTGALAGGEDGTSTNPAEMMSKLKMASVTIVDGQEAHVVLGAPPTDPVHVHGRVTHSGVPYSGAIVMFMGESKDVLAGTKMASIAADGAYAVDVDAPGRYSVLVQRMSGKPGEQQNMEFTRTVPAVKSFELDLTMPTGGISGRVTDADGAPVSGANITISADTGVQTGSLLGGQLSVTSTDAEGRYELLALKPGTYRVGAGGSPFGSMLGGTASHGRTVRSNVRVKEGEWEKDVDFRLEKPNTVKVTVVDDHDQPVAGANLFARDGEGRLVDTLSMLTTGTDGTAVYGGLVHGTFTFSARFEGRASGESARITVDSDAAKSVKLTLLPATVLIVRVVDKEDKPAEAWLSVVDDAGREVASMMGMADLTERFRGGGTSHTEQRIGPLPAGKYRVLATRADGQKCEKPVSLSGQAERSISLKFSE